jgi:hypothetical protein
MKTEKKSRDVTYWLNEIESAKKREKEFRKDGSRIMEIYEGKDPNKIPFNILFSNTETLSPALYSDIPRPIVKRRFEDDDPLGKESAKAGTRMLEFLIDTNIDGYETFDDGMKANVLDALLPGRGVLNVKYDADVVEAQSMSYKKSELVCIDTRSWDKVYFGYAKKWSRMPWVCYEEEVDKKEAANLFGEAIAKELVYTKENADKEDESTYEERDTGEKKTTTIYQIWDKDGGRKIRYVSPNYPKYLLVQNDTLQLTGFFNCPRPLKFVETVNDLTPVPLYRLYENQASELNRLTRRINKIIDAIKARGVYDAELGDDLKSLMTADDNELVPADKSSSLAAEKGLDNAIWFMPIDKLIIVLQQLYVAREACKQVIYEIIAIADVMRGQSKASETLGAQEIKTQWGTLRIQPKQVEVQRYARDILRMMLEVAATKFSEETWAKMTGLPYLTFKQKSQAEQMMKVLQQQPPSPEIQKQQMQVQAELQKPSWGDILALLKDDIQRSYKIDIETNSTLQPEAAEDQKQISDFMTAMGQFLNGVGPLIANGVMPFEVAQTMLLTISRRFRFGDEIEDTILKMKPPEPEDNSKQAEADKAAEQAKLETQKQVELAKHTREQQAEQNKMQLEQMKIASDERQTQMKLEAERELEMMRIEAAKKESIATLAATRNVEEMKARIHQETELKKAGIMTGAQMEVANINAAQKDKAAGVPQVAASLETKDANMSKLVEMQTEILKVVKAPRKTRAKRGSDGKIVETISELAE